MMQRQIGSIGAAAIIAASLVVSTAALAQSGAGAGAGAGSGGSSGAPKGVTGTSVNTGGVVPITGTSSGSPSSSAERGPVVGNTLGTPGPGGTADSGAAGGLPVGETAPDKKR